MHVIASSLKDLLPKCIDENLYSDYSPKQASLIWLHKSLLKKYHGGKISHSAAKAALETFRESNGLCKDYEIDETSYYYDLLIEVRNELHRMIHNDELQSSRISLAKALSALRPGPGSTLGTKETNYLGKLFHSTITSYSSDFGLYHFFVENLDTRWKAAELHRLRQYGISSVKSSRLTFAKKSFDVARVINTEASLEMLFQLGHAENLKQILLREFNIDLSKQPVINSMLARVGSLDGTNCTIDLKDASNRIPTKLVKFVLPQQAYDALDLVRAKCIDIDDGYIDGYCGIQPLHMFSTQGNGFTFPLQTLLFATIVKVCYASMGLPTNCHNYPHFSVFGDDIIVVKQCYDKVVNMLEYCGFTVNRLKSYNSGHFRESCGTDYFKGHDIRGIYIKELSNETHVYSAFNRLLRWSARHDIDISPVLHRLKGLAVFRPVPFDEQDIAGFKIMQRDLRSPKYDANGSLRYRAWRSTAEYRVIEKRYKDVSADAIMHCVLAGHLLSGRKERKKKPVEYFTKIPQRPLVKRFSLKRSVCPFWDYIPRTTGLTNLQIQVAWTRLNCYSLFHPMIQSIKRLPMPAGSHRAHAKHAKRKRRR